MSTSRILGGAALLAALALSSCNNGGGGSGNTAADPFVTNLIQNETNETGTPVETEGKTFVFPDDDTAFDDVLPADTGSVVD